MDEQKRDEIKKIFAHLNHGMIDHIIDEVLIRNRKKQTIESVNFGKGVHIQNEEQVNIYRCQIGDKTRIAPFVEIQSNVDIGKNCKIQSHTFICSNVTIKDNCFIGHGVIFINDKYPRVHSKEPLTYTTVEENASIGSNSTILGGITIGKNAIIGAGSVVTKNVPPNEIWIGNPTKPITNLFVSQKTIDGLP